MISSVIDTDKADDAAEPGQNMNKPFPGGGDIRGRRAGSGELRCLTS